MSGKKAGADSKRLETALPEWSINLMRPIIGLAMEQSILETGTSGSREYSSNGGLIIAANHQSYGDPFWLSVPVKRPTRFLAWNEAFRGP